MIHHIGNDFTKSKFLNLLPGITLPRGYWQIAICSFTIEGNNNVYSNSVYYCSGLAADFNVLIGQDVKELSFTCNRHLSYPGNPQLLIRYSLRVDRLIFLNILYKLTQLTVKI